MSSRADRAFARLSMWVELKQNVHPENNTVEHHAHHGSHLFFILCSVVICSAIGTRAYLTRQMSTARGSYPTRQEGNVMLFRKPLALRRQQRTLFWFAIFVTSGTVVGAQALNDAPLSYIEGIVGLSISFIFLYLSGPDDIRLNGKQRTYERTVGWPWKPTTRFGSFNGVKGVCISPRNTVWLLLEKPDFVKSASGIALSYSGAGQSARALADELNLAYGFSIVPYPKYGL